MESLSYVFKRGHLRMFRDRRTAKLNNLLFFVGINFITKKIKLIVLKNKE